MVILYTINGFVLTRGVFKKYKLQCYRRLLWLHLYLACNWVYAWTAIDLISVMKTPNCYLVILKGTHFDIASATIYIIMMYVL